VKVWFLRGEQLESVERAGSTAEDGLRHLLAGPTAPERKAYFRSHVPRRTPVRSVSVARGIATADLGAAFVESANPESLLARMAQLVYTLAGADGATKVRLLIDGGKAPDVFPGLSTGRPITVESLEPPPQAPPAGAPPEAPTVQAAPASAPVRAAQQRLVDLGYLLPRDVDGRLGPATQNAVLAFQKWEGLRRDGALGPKTTARLQPARRPRPITRGGTGKRAEILIDRQVALMIDNNQLVRAIPVSSGKPSTPTPPGDYKVYAKFARWWSVPFREWLLWALPFTGGIAFHQFPVVPTYPASHGCVRESYVVAKWTYDFARVGMPVKVIARSA
jgi:N-acetylmuramoyl-L-alanine amidase